MIVNKLDETSIETVVTSTTTFNNTYTFDSLNTRKNGLLAEIAKIDQLLAYFKPDGTTI